MMLCAASLRYTRSRKVLFSTLQHFNHSIRTAGVSAQDVKELVKSGFAAGFAAGVHAGI